MTTQLAKQLCKAVQKNVGGNLYEYYRLKYVTNFGATVFSMQSTNGKEWVVVVNTLEPERFETVCHAFYASGQLRKA